MPALPRFKSTTETPGGNATHVQRNGRYNGRFQVGNPRTANRDELSG
jgi:hypothetical protein